jgi:AcrR family transcriptional regulator
LTIEPVTGGYETRGRTGQKLRTRNALTSAATELIAAGGQPTVLEVAEAAGISKSTAYRYFPSQELMYSEVLLAATVGADREAVDAAARSEGDTAARLDRVIRADHSLITKHEHAFRTGLRAWVLLIDSYPDVPRVRSNRVRYLNTALAPLRDRLPAAAMRRLVAALALCVGIEAALVTQENCGLSAEESEQVKRWAAAALLQAALDDSTIQPPKDIN